jgi:hypothetical protein
MLMEISPSSQILTHQNKENDSAATCGIGRPEIKKNASLNYRTSGDPIANEKSKKENSQPKVRRRACRCGKPYSACGTL